MSPSPVSGVHTAAVLSAVRERVRSGRVEIPVLGSVALEILAMVTNDDADARQLSQLVHRDPVLAGQVMRMANSAAYGARQRVSSLQQAVARLGFSLLRDVAVASSVRSRVFSFGGYENMAREVWRHSLATGAVAREIQRRRGGDGGVAFLCGLLHDIGKALVLRVVADETDGDSSAVPRPALRTLLDTDHERLSGDLGKRWNLPANVVTALEYHHTWARASEKDGLTPQTQLADAWAHRMMPAEEEPPPRLDEAGERAIVTKLGLSVDAISAVFDQRAVVEALVCSIA